jgi:hypothetical protein
MSFIPQLPGILPRHPMTHEDPPRAESSHPTHTPEVTEMETHPKESEDHQLQDLEKKTELASAATVHTSPEKRKERTSILGKLGFRKSVVQSVEAQESAPDAEEVSSPPPPLPSSLLLNS